MENLVAAVGRVVPDEVAPERRQPAAVTDEVADGQLAGDVRVIQLKGGQVLGCLVLPAELALVYENGQGSGGERFRTRRDRKQGPLIDRRDFAGLSDAETLGDDHA